jgi:lysophospholipase L1-like esterase
VIGVREILIAVAALAVALFIYSSVRNLYLISVSKKMVDATESYDRRTDNKVRTMLVLGDSTGVGVGAVRPAESVPGRVAEQIGATYIENRAVSGATIDGLPSQVAGIELDSYNLILIQIGANDIVRFRDAERSAENLRQIVESLPPADIVVIISAGDVGTAYLFPLPLRPLYTRKTNQFHEAFEEAFPQNYVNLAKDPGNELIAAQPVKYLSADKFHPSSAGYGLWFEALRPVLGK